MINPDITIIIASAGDKKRAKSLQKAVQSIEHQKNINAKILIVFNGPNVSEDCSLLFKDKTHITITYQQKPSLPNALHYGRSCIDTDYFGFLDDDDLYIEDTLQLKYHLLIENPAIDVVASNGLIDFGDTQGKLLCDTLAPEKDPMAMLFQQNWLASCGGLFRSKTVGLAYFKKDVKYYEWTMTAFLLSLDRNIAYLPEPTFIINQTMGSLSASSTYLETRPDFLTLLLTYPISKQIKKVIKQRRCAAFHQLSEYYLKQQNRKKAWLYHFKSLFNIQGLKYLSYSYHLIRFKK